MLSKIKLKNWLLSELEDVAIGYRHNVPTKVLSIMFDRPPNAISKLMDRSGMRALKKAKPGSPTIQMRQAYRSPHSVKELIDKVRAQYNTPQLLHDFLCPSTFNHLQQHEKPKVKKVSPQVSKRKTVFKERHEWTSLNRVINEAKLLGYDIVQKDLAQADNTQSVKSFLICNGLPTTIHQLILLVNKHRLKCGQSLLLLEGITNL